MPSIIHETMPPIPPYPHLCLSHACFCLCLASFIAFSFLLLLLPPPTRACTCSAVLGLPVTAGRQLVDVVYRPRRDGLSEGVTKYFACIEWLLFSLRENAIDGSRYALADSIHHPDREDEPERGVVRACSGRLIGPIPLSIPFLALFFIFIHLPVT